MSERTGLARIEKRAWLRVFEDGIWDIAVGLVLLGFGLSIWAGLPYLAGVFPAVSVPLIQSFKRRIDGPRIGHVAFGRRRRVQSRRVSWILTALVAFGAVFFVLTGWAVGRSEAPAFVGWFRVHFEAMLGVIWGSALAAAGWSVGFRRFYVHGFLVFAALLGSDLAPGHALGVALTAAGGAITGVGIFFLIRFLRRYPRVAEPIPQESDG